MSVNEEINRGGRTGPVGNKAKYHIGYDGSVHPDAKRRCRSCSGEKTRLLRIANPVAYQESQRRYRLKYPEKILDYSRRYYARASQSEDYRAKTRRWASRWKRENPLKAAGLRASYRARKRNAPGFFNSADFEKIVSQQEGLCAHCQRETKLTVDHIVPLSRGGSNWPSNLQALCGPCNSRKNNRF